MAKFRDTFELVDKVSKPLLKMSRNFAKLDKSIAKSQQRLEKFKKQTENIAKIGNKVKSVGQGMTVGLTLPIVAMGGAMVKAASDMEETLNKVDVSFGRNSETVKEWAKTSITSMGLSQQSALDSAALYGDMATGMGLSQKKASEMAMSLTQLGADLASFKNISNDVAQTALKSIFTGETESLKNLGVVMTQTNLEQYAYSRGIRKKMKNMSEAEKIQLRYNYVMSQTKNAQGDFIRTGGGASNQMRMFQENMKELGVTFGQYILPYFTKVIKKLNELLVSFNNLSPKVKKTILVLGAILAVIGPIVTVVGSLITAFAGLNAVIGFLVTNPVVAVIIGIVAAIAALAVGVAYCYRKFEGFRKVVQAVWSVLKLLYAIQVLAIKKIWEFIKPIVQAGVSFATWISPLRIIIEALGKILGLANQVIQKFGGFRGIGDAVKGWADNARAKVDAYGNTSNTTNNTTNTTNNTTNNNYYAEANPKKAKLTTP